MLFRKSCFLQVLKIFLPPPINVLIFQIERIFFRWILFSSELSTFGVLFDKSSSAFILQILLQRRNEIEISRRQYLICHNKPKIGSQRDIKRSEVFCGGFNRVQLVFAKAIKETDWSQYKVMQSNPWLKKDRLGPLDDNMITIALLQPALMCYYFTTFTYCT